MHVSTTQLSLSFLLLVSLFFPPSLSDPRATEVQFLCNGTQFLLPTIFIPLFTQEMNSLSHIIRKNSFATHNTTISTLTIYTLAQCHNDLSQTDCFLCYSSACTKLSRCLPSSSSRVYLDGCFLRYDNYDFMHESVDHALDNVTCSDESVAVEGFERRVDGVLENVTRRAVGSGGFGVGEIEGVYALAQCWKSVSVEGCRECLRKGSEGVKRMCGGKKEGRAMNAGCFLRYSTAKFYNDGNEDDGGDDNGKSFFSLFIFCGISGKVVGRVNLYYLSIFAAYPGCGDS